MKKVLLIFQLLLTVVLANAQMLNPVKVTSTLKTNGSAEAEIVFSCKIQPGWHVYSTGLGADGPISASFHVNKMDGAELVGKLKAKGKEISTFDPLFEMKLRYFEGSATFVQKVKFTQPNYHIDATKLRISQGNTGKKRTPQMRKAQSNRMKGIEPKAASEGAKKWRETHGGGYWGNHKIPDTARANMKLAQQKRGKAVRAFAPDGTWQDFNTMNDAAKALGMNPGSIANNLKSNGVCNNGYRFKTTVPNFPRP